MANALPWWFYFVTFSAGVLASGHAFTSYFVRQWSGKRAIGGGILGLSVMLACLPNVVGSPFANAAMAWRVAGTMSCLVGALVLFFGYRGERAASIRR